MGTYKITNPNYDPSIPGGSHPLGKTAFKKCLNFHEDIINWMLVNPGGSMRDCALDLGRAPTTIYIITNSDAFRERLRVRRNEFNGKVDQGFITQIESLGRHTLDLISEKLDRHNVDPLGLGDLLSVADLSMKALGYGQKNSPPPVINQTVNHLEIRREVLSNARSIYQSPARSAKGLSESAEREELSNFGDHLSLPAAD